MWSLLGTILFFALLILLSAVAQHRRDKETKIETKRVSKEIESAAEVAQRRHRQKYGRDDTGLHRTMTAPHPVVRKSRA